MAGFISLECNNWFLAASLQFLNKKALDICENKSICGLM